MTGPPLAIGPMADASDPYTRCPMLKPPDLDPLAVRRQFARRAPTIDASSFLLREVEGRMLQRLDLVRLEPRRIVDVGCGRGHGLRALGERYPQALALGADSAEAMLRGGRSGGGPAPRAGWRGWLDRARSSASRLQAEEARPGFAASGSPAWVADAAALGLREGWVDLLWSNLAWHWFIDPPAVAREWLRVLRPEGLLMLSAFGVDTFRELRSIGAQLPEFPDLHDIGDLLGQAGFSAPVLDAQRLTVHWQDPRRLLADLHGMAGNAARDRGRGLRGRDARARWIRAIEELRGPDGRIALSIELVFAHAWAPSNKVREDGAIAIRWMSRQGITSGETPGAGSAASSTQASAPRSRLE